MTDDEHKRFCRLLVKVFPDGVHGTKVGLGEFMSGWLLYYTVKRVLTAQGQHGGGDGSGKLSIERR